jgi:hypothetical protein
VPDYIVETYVPQAHSTDLDQLSKAALTATAGTTIRHIRSYLVPHDEMCMHVYHANSPAQIVKAAARAGIAIERIVETVETAVEAICPRG